MHLRTMLAGVACLTVAACGGAGDPGTPVGCTSDELQTSVENCGICGHVCPAVPNAAAACVQGECGRSPCKPGWLDLTDAPGCETEGYTPVPEFGLVFAAISTAGTYDDSSASESHRLQGVLGEPTPALLEGAVEARSQGHRNVAGFNAALH